MKPKKLAVLPSRRQRFNRCRDIQRSSMLDATVVTCANDISFELRQGLLLRTRDGNSSVTIRIMIWMEECKTECAFMYTKTLRSIHSLFLSPIVIHSQRARILPASNLLSTHPSIHAFPSMWQIPMNMSPSPSPHVGSMQCR